MSKVPTYIFGHGGVGVECYYDTKGRNVVVVVPLRTPHDLQGKDQLDEENAFMELATVLVFPSFKQANHVYQAMIESMEMEE